MTQQQNKKPVKNQPKELNRYFHKHFQVTDLNTQRNIHSQRNTAQNHSEVSPSIHKDDCYLKN